MHILLHPSYFPNIVTCIALAQAESIAFEYYDTYQKQTYRNRTLIYSANGKLSLNIPVQYSQKNRQFYRDVQIANDGKWQAIHWKSLYSAYRTSPFFEHYADELEPLFLTQYDFLLDFNMKCLEVLAECLQWKLLYSFTKSFQKKTPHTDLRFLINARKEKDIKIDPYIQVFSNKHGFINNLSLLDLMFNEGPNTLNYLKSQDINKLLL